MKSLIVASFLLVISLGRAVASEHPFFSAIDVYDSSMAQDKFRSSERTFIKSAVNVSSETSASSTADPGFGIRLGVFGHTSDKWEAGGSIGFIVGPKVTSTIKNRELDSGGVVISSGEAKIRSQGDYFRLMAEAGRLFSFPRGVKAKLGGAVGLSFGTIKQTQTVSGSASKIDSPYTEKAYSTSLSAEVSPSVIIPVVGQELELGARYALIPTETDSPRIKKFEWNAVSLFLGCRFGPKS